MGALGTLLRRGYSAAISGPGKYLSIPAGMGGAGYLAGRALTDKRDYESSSELSKRKNFEGKRLGLAAGLGAAGTMIPGVFRGTGIKSRLLGALLGAGAGYAISAPFDPENKVRVIKEPNLAQNVAGSGRTGPLGSRTTNWLFDDSYMRRLSKL